MSRAGSCVYTVFILEVSRMVGSIIGIWSIDTVGTSETCAAEPTAYLISKYSPSDMVFVKDGGRVMLHEQNPLRTELQLISV